MLIAQREIELARTGRDARKVGEIAYK